MSNPNKILLLAAGLLLLIGGSYFAYTNLAPGTGLLGDMNVPGESQAASSGEEASTAPSGVDGNTQPEESSEQEYVMTVDFTVYDRDSQPVKLSDFYGKPIVLNFWASWCPPCKSEMPEFDHVWMELGEEVAFLMINATDGSRETLEIATRYVDEEEYSFPVYYDLDREAAYLYGISSLPTTLFIDRNGYVVTGALGQIDEELLRLGIEYAVEQGPLTDQFEP